MTVFSNIFSRFVGNVKSSFGADTKFYNTPLVTILVPCYNSDKTVLATLQSLQKSTYQNLEVLVVDDGSVNKVDSIVASLKDKRFHYHWKENEGLGLTRNYGINNAKGKYIFFLDSDDVVYTDSIQNLVEYAVEEDLDVVSGVTVRKLYESGKESEWYRRIYKDKKVSTLENRLFLYDDTLSTNKLYNVEFLIAKEMYFIAGLYEDKIFTAKLYSQTEKIGLIPNRVYVWYVYGDATSITTSKTIQNYVGRIRSLNKLWEYLPELRKYHQFSAFFNHDLTIYLREFIFFSDEDRYELFNITREFIYQYKEYYYERLLPQSLHRGCLNALLQNDYDSFAFISNTVSELYQQTIKHQERV